MTTSEAGRQFIKAFEQCRLAAYQDQAGWWTVGWGRKVLAPITITQAMADDWFDHDVAMCERVIALHVKTALKQNQFDALVSFVFNVGPRAFVESTLLKKLNSGQDVAPEFLRWHYVTRNGRKVASLGLYRRRKKERDLYVQGTL